jgi:UMF1 family MFS transporter
MTTTTTPRNDPKNIFGWCMYDWANSAYITTVSVGLLPIYFTSVVVPAEGVTILGTQFEAASLLPFAIGFSAALTFLFAPILGAISDFSATKKKFVLFFAYMGSLATLLLYFSGAGDVVLTLVLFIIAQTSFVAANVFYDAFLPQIVSRDQMDVVSGKGYSYGYVGGGLQFAIAMGVVLAAEPLGISADTAARIGIVMAAVWWAGFSLFTLKYLRESGEPTPMPDEFRTRPRPLALAAIGLTRIIGTTRRIGRFRHLVLFLVAFMFYNDGIQAVIAMATLYGKDELGLSDGTLMGTLLVIQFVAIAGALIFSRLAGRVGTKRAIMITLVIWSGIVIYAYFIETASEYFALGGLVGIVMGGSQALSRSFYGSMVPPEASAEFYGFYSVFSKFSAIWGPFLFGAVNLVTGSSRSAIVSLIIFFIVGLVLLYFVDEDKARLAGAEGAF